MLCKDGYFDFFSRTDFSSDKIRVDSTDGRNNRSSTGSRSKLEDDSEKQLEMQLLESPLTETNIRQPKKEVTIIYFSLSSLHCNIDNI